MFCLPCHLMHIWLTHDDDLKKKKKKRPLIYPTCSLFLFYFIWYRYICIYKYTSIICLSIHSSLLLLSTFTFILSVFFFGAYPSALAELIIVGVLIYIPEVHKIFDTAPLNIRYFLIPLSCGILLGILQEIIKYLCRHYKTVDRIFGHWGEICLCLWTYLYNVYTNICMY